MRRVFSEACICEGAPITCGLIPSFYAEAFRSIFAEVLITARDRKWLDHAIHAATGHASSTIMCDCEAGLDRYVGPGGDESFATPDGRPGAVLQFHVPRFRKDRRKAIDQALLARISQNILTCPTTACFNLRPVADGDDYVRTGRKVAYFGDGFESVQTRHDRQMWVIPTMGGDFAIDRRFGYSSGVMGGNLWFLGNSEDSAIHAAELAAAAVENVPGTITTFPGGVAASASKAGSQYKFLFARTYEQSCPTLKEELGAASQVPDGVVSIMEIIINGYDLDTVAEATYQAIDAASQVSELHSIQLS